MRRSRSNFLETGVLVLFGPLVTGFIQKLKARLQSRAGGWPLAVIATSAELLQGDGAERHCQPVLWRGPGAGARCHRDCRHCPMLPVARARQLRPLPLGDAILLLALLALARFLLAIGALDAGGAFGGMGASREMTVGVLVEPALMLVVFSLPCGRRAARPTWADPPDAKAASLTFTRRAPPRPARAACAAGPASGGNRGAFRWTTPIRTSNSPCCTRACCSSTRGRASPASSWQRTPSNSSYARPGAAPFFFPVGLA